jgi:hypothetical protein
VVIKVRLALVLPTLSQIAHGPALLLLLLLLLNHHCIC